MQVNADTVIEGLTITNGNATSGSAMFNSGADPTVNNCVFVANASSSWGGAIYNLSNSNPAITGCAFIGNTGGGGGAIMNDGSDPKVLDCIFHGNTATGSGGAIYNLNGSLPEIVNTTFSGNTAVGGVGGGMVSWAGSTPVVTNCTFNANTATSGGAMFSGTSSSSTAANGIFRNNAPNQIFNEAGSSSIVTYSNVEGGFAGVGNIDAAPYFIDPDGPDDTLGTADDDLRIEHGSPCIDAGDNTAPGLIGVVTDLAGNDRFLDDPGVADTGNGTAPIVDMGAYEFQGSTLCAADTDGNNTIDVVDLLAVLGAWGPCPAPCPPTCSADVNNDCVVDVQDLLAVLGAWGSCQ